MSSPIPADIMEALRRDDEQNGAVRAYELLQSPLTKRFIVHASTAGIPWETPDAPRPDLEDVTALWDWAWSGAKLDSEAIGSAIAIAHESSSRIASSVRMTRVMFPDGTLSRWAKAVLEAEVMDAIKKLDRGKGTKR